MLEIEQPGCMQKSSRLTGKGVLILPASPPTLLPIPFGESQARTSQPQAQPPGRTVAGSWGQMSSRLTGVAFQKETAPNSAPTVSGKAVPCHENPKKFF